MKRIVHAFVWLRRIRHCQGFGIQSPTDFSFVRDVVNEQRPYYAYSEVGRGDDWLRRKLGQLYFRLANYMQPIVIADTIGYADYLSAGCSKAIITHQFLPPAPEPTLAIVRADNVSPALLSLCKDKTMLVVEGIATHRQMWQTVKQWPAATITFDLYYCGIATFNPARTKQHYIVNF